MVSRCSCFLIALAACGGDPVRHTSDAPRADASIDGAPDAAPDACVTCQVAGSLTGLLWQLPCADTGSPACSTMPTTTVSATVAGAPGVTYDVTAHFRGVIEQKTYSSGCQDQSWFAGGADNGDTYNVYELSISSPPQHYFLNAGTSNITHCWVIDYEKTFRADAGATVTLYAASKDNSEIRNIDENGQPLSVAGTTVTQPYDGQFIEIDVVSVVPDPVASGATVGTAGPTSELAFTGSQYALVASSASLMPQDMTVETWFNFAGTPGAFNSLVGKPYQGGTTDSFAIWYEGSALHAGPSLGSTSGAASVPWTPTAGEWHHAAMTYDHTSMLSTFYIDGEVTSCATNALPAYDSQPVMIGADSNNGGVGGFFDGGLDEVRVFSTTRTPDQVWADMHTHQLGATNGLVGEWTFDEGSGQTSADSSGNSNPATLGANGSADAADPAWVSSDVPH